MLSAPYLMAKLAKQLHFFKERTFQPLNRLEHSGD